MNRAKLGYYYFGLIIGLGLGVLIGYTIWGH